MTQHRTVLAATAALALGAIPGSALAAPQVTIDRDGMIALNGTRSDKILDDIYGPASGDVFILADVNIGRCTVNNCKPS